MGWITLQPASTMSARWNSVASPGHAIAQEALVASAVLDAKIVGVVEIHVHQAQLHQRAGNFRAEAERDAFLGLDVNHQAIGLQISYRGIAEQDKRGAAELDDDFRGAGGQALSRAQIKGNSGPAPIVDLKFKRDVRFGVGVGSDVGLVAVAGHALAVDDAFAVLAADGVSQDVFGHERLDGVQNFGLFVAHFVGVEGNGRLHRGHGKELKQMVRNHVAESARGFIEPAAMLDAYGFGRGDLHVIDVIAVPERLDDVVGEAKDHDVLDGFFAEIVVDAVNLVFRREPASGPG